MKTKKRQAAFRPAVGTRKPNAQRNTNIGSILHDGNTFVDVFSTTHERNYPHYQLR